MTRLIAHLLIALLQVAPDIVTAGYGVTLRVTPAQALDGPAMSVAIGATQASAEIRRLSLPGVVAVADARVESADTACIVGRTVAGREVLSVVDVPSGSVVREFQSDQIPWMADERAYRWIEQASGRRARFIPARRRLQLELTPEEFVRSLTTGQTTERTETAQLLEAFPSMQEAAPVHDAVLGELARVVHTPIPAARTREEATRGANEHAYLRTLISAAISLDRERALPLLVQANEIEARGPLLKAGEAVVPALVAVLQRPVPAGYYEDFRVDRLRVLADVLRRSQPAPATKAQIRDATLSILSGRASASELQVAIEVATELDDGAAFDASIGALASSDAAVRDHGVTASDQIGRVRRSAQTYMGRKIFIP